MTKQFTVHLAMSVEGDGATESERLMIDCSDQQMALYEVCASNTLQLSRYDTMKA